MNINLKTLITISIIVFLSCNSLKVSSKRLTLVFCGPYYKDKVEVVIKGKTFFEDKNLSSNIDEIAKILHLNRRNTGKKIDIIVNQDTFNVNLKKYKKPYIWVEISPDGNVGIKSSEKNYPSI